MFCFYAHIIHGQVTYCTPAGACPSNDKVYITSVKFNTLNNNTGCGGYVLFPESGTTTTTVERGTSYQMRVGLYGYYYDALHQVYTYYNQGVLAYIDFNADGDFDDTGERIGVGTGDDSTPAVGMITIPSGAKLGKTRMRIRHIISTGGADGITACNNMANNTFHAYDIEDYTITVIEKNVLPPSCPSVYAPTNNAVNIPRNPGLTFTWDGATGGTNTTYDFYLGTSPTSLSAVGVNIVSFDGTTGKYSHPDFLEPGTTYYYKVVAKNDRGTANTCSVQKFTTAMATNDYYCTPTANCGLFYNSYIKSVNFNTISNVTTCSGQSAYMLYPASGATTTTVTKGSSYTLSIQTSSSCNTGYLGAWIDYNRNGSFDDTGEFTVLADPGAMCAVRTVSIAVPTSAVSGATRMRVRMGYVGQPVVASESCTDYYVGETEDYTITIAAPSACGSLSAAYTKIDDLNSANATGSITVTPSGGTLPYSITWTGGLLSGFHPTGLSEGVYYATITDGAGCSYAMPPININAPPVFKLEGVAVINPSCKENGSIRVDVSGGVGPYTFSWNDESLAGNFVNNLEPGTYSVEIHDSQGQVLQTGPIELRALSASHTVDPPLCDIGSPGYIHVTTVGGIAPYQYKWTKVEPAEPVFFTGPDVPVSTGIYSVTITDAVNCSIVVSDINVTGPQPIAVDVSIKPVNCNGNGSATGEIWLKASGGMAPYRYEAYFNSVPQTPAFLDDTEGFRYVDVPIGQGYEIVAFDASGCQSQYVFTGVVASLPEPDLAGGYISSCSGKAVELHYGPYQPGMNFVWYADAEGTIALDTAVAFITPVLTDYVTYYMATYQHGCRSNLIVPYVVSVVQNPGKPVITTEGSATLCNGNSVSLRAPGGYKEYRWSTGAQTSSITASDAGSYTVQIEDDYGCESPVSDPLAVIEGLPSATPAVSASGPLIFCAGDEVVLSAPEGYVSYRWSDNSINKDVTIKSSGVYSVRAVEAGACESGESAPVEVVVNAMPNAPGITASGPLSFCAGGQVVLTVAGPGQYRWSTGASTQQIQVNESGTYTVAVIENDCESAAAEAVVSVFDLPAVPESIEQISASVLKVIGGSNEYVWTLNGNELPVTTAEITAAASGRYEARSISGQGCVSDGSAGYDFVVTGLEPAGQYGFSLYPNPSSGMLHVVVGKETDRAEVQIVNTLGQRFDGLRMEHDGQELTIDVSALPAGFYTLMVKRGGGVVARAFVKQ